MKACFTAEAVKEFLSYNCGRQWMESEYWDVVEGKCCSFGPNERVRDPDLWYAIKSDLKSFQSALEGTNLEWYLEKWDVEHISSSRNGTGLDSRMHNQYALWHAVGLFHGFYQFGDLKFLRREVKRVQLEDAADITLFIHA